MFVSGKFVELLYPRLVNYHYRRSIFDLLLHEATALCAQRISSFIVSYRRRKMALISRGEADNDSVGGKQKPRWGNGRIGLRGYEGVEEAEEQGPSNCSCHWARGSNSYLTYSLRCFVFFFSNAFLPALFTHNARPKINKRESIISRNQMVATGDGPTCSFEFSIMDNGVHLYFINEPFESRRIGL